MLLKVYVVHKNEYKILLSSEKYSFTGMHNELNLSPPILFCPANIICFLGLLHIYMVANSMNQDQTALF